jgi:PIN domain nuclease of toxin-antitoxin system
VGGEPLILLDTRVLLWLDRDDPALGNTADKIAEEALALGALATSAITFWEIALLLAKDRVELARSLPQWRHDLLSSGLVECPVVGEIGIAAAHLEHLHGDPADRMILATAVHRRATLVTADQRLLNWPGPLDRDDARL